MTRTPPITPTTMPTIPPVPSPPLESGEGVLEMVTMTVWTTPFASVEVTADVLGEFEVEDYLAVSSCIVFIELCVGSPAALDASHMPPGSPDWGYRTEELVLLENEVVEEVDEVEEENVCLRVSVPLYHEGREYWG